MHCSLPVSKKIVDLRSPEGREDVLFCEWTGGEAELALALLNALTHARNGQDQADWGELPVTDNEWALLQLRRFLFGDLVRTGSVCKQPDCGAKIDISFRIGDYLGQFQMTVPKDVEKLPEPGWFALAGQGIQFRLPTGNDQLAATFSAQPEIELQRRCVVPGTLSGDLLQRLQETMECMAPSLSGLLQGACPDCACLGEFYFDVQTYVLRELMDQAKFIFDDVHLLAAHYHWSEHAILNMPRQRRYRYVDAITRELSLNG